MKSVCLKLHLDVGNCVVLEDPNAAAKCLKFKEYWPSPFQKLKELGKNLKIVSFNAILMVLSAYSTVHVVLIIAGLMEDSLPLAADRLCDIL